MLIVAQIQPSGRCMGLKYGKWSTPCALPVSHAPGMKLVYAAQVHHKHAIPWFSGSLLWLRGLGGAVSQGPPFRVVLRPHGDFLENKH